MVSGGVGQRIADACLRGEVDDALGRGRVEHGAEGGLVLDLDLMERKRPLGGTRLPLQSRPARLLEGGVVIVVEGVDADDMMAPARGGRALTCEPMKPAAPVTRMVSGMISGCTGYRLRVNFGRGGRRSELPIAHLRRHPRPVDARLDVDQDPA